MFTQYCEAFKVRAWQTDYPAKFLSFARASNYAPQAPKPSESKLSAQQVTSEYK